MEISAQDTGSQVNYYVDSKETGNHCHMWRENETGGAGVVHRGECNVCEDVKNSSSGSSSVEKVVDSISKFFGL